MLYLSTFPSFFLQPWREVSHNPKPFLPQGAMKQELATTESKASPPPPPVIRSKAQRSKDSPRLATSPSGASPGSKTRPKLVVPTEANNNPRARRSILPPKEREMENSKIPGRPPSTARTVEQYAKLRCHGDGNCRGSQDETNGKEKDMKKILDGRQSLVKELQTEVSGLKAELERMQRINVELESQNRQFKENLAAAEAKITALLDRRDKVEVISQETQPSEFRDVQKLIANKLEIFRLKKEVIREDTATKMQSLAGHPGAKTSEIQPKNVVTGPPPPPPPPPPRLVPPRANTMQKATELVEFYHSLTKRRGKKETLGGGNGASPVTSNAHNSIVGELQNRSAHLLAIKADVEKKGVFINHLIEKVQSAVFTDMEDVLCFVDWLDAELSVLADERAVLKHFKWPERKADGLREAAFEYRDLKRLQVEVSSFEDDASLPCEATLKKIATLLDKLERSIQRLIKLREATMLSYREQKIPTDWMLDSGMVSKIKLASMNLAKVYMKRVLLELESAPHSEKGSIQEALLFQGVQFAYRAHQFAGGLDSETMCAFKELRERVRSNGRGSRELLHGITLP